MLVSGKAGVLDGINAGWILSDQSVIPYTPFKQFQTLVRIESHHVLMSDQNGFVKHLDVCFNFGKS